MSGPLEPPEHQTSRPPVADTAGDLGGAVLGQAPRPKASQSACPASLPRSSRVLAAAACGLLNGCCNTGRRRAGSAPGRTERPAALTLTLGEAAHSSCRPDRPGDEGVSVEEISIGEFARRSRLSLRALRLYDERGVLVPARVDQGSGYRYYDTAQLDDARLVVMMRELQLPLAAVRELLACDPADAAERIAEHWRDAEAAHDARRELAGYLVSRLRG